MKKLIFLLFLPLFVNCTSFNGDKDSFNHNQEHLVYSTIWFQNSPEAAALYFQGFNLAKERVLQFVNVVGVKPKAVIVDIDETMVNNSAFQGKSIETGNPYSTEFWKQWSDLAMATPMPGAVEFSKFCDSLGVEVFYISNRKENELTKTMQNMDSLGFAFVKTENFLLKVDKSGKEERRIKVAEKFEIILLLGDNLNDFSDVFENRGDDWGMEIVKRYKNEFGRRFILFPNPMYGEWEKNVYGPQRDQSNHEMFIKRRAAVKRF